MMALVPAIAAAAGWFAQPLPMVDVCSRPPAEMEAALAIEGRRVASYYAGAGPNFPLFTYTPACRWRCDPGGPTAPRCTSNLLNLLQYTCRDHEKQLGMNVPDAEYLANARDKFGGEMMTVPPALIAATKGMVKVEDFKQALRREGWKYLEFSSNSVTNTPNGYGRVLIVIENDNFDRWIQIATADTSPHLLGRNVDFAAVEKRDQRTGAKLSHQNFYFNGYSRRVNGWEQEGLGSLGPLNRCIMCHPSGLRGIYPVPTSIAPAEKDTLAYLQKKLDSTWTNGFGGYYDPEEVGPPMGVVDPPGRIALLAKGCALGINAREYPRIARAMNCATCHDGQYRGFLTAGTDYGTITHKIVHDIDEGRMPPNDELSLYERLAVARCLRAEYAEQLRTWLTHATCFSAPSETQQCTVGQGIGHERRAAR